MSESTGTEPSRPESVGSVARFWWRGLNGLTKGHPNPDRAALAELRRCREPVDAVTVPAFHELWRRMRDAGQRFDDGERADRLAAAAIVLAHVRSDKRGKRVARALGPARMGADREAEDRTAVMRYSRFRRLLQVEEPAELAAAMRRAVTLLDRHAHVADLAESIVFWGEGVRRRWAFEYFDTTPPRGSEPPAGADAPAADPSPSPSP